MKSRKIHHVDGCAKDEHEKRNQQAAEPKNKQEEESFTGNKHSSTCLQRAATWFTSVLMALDCKKFSHEIWGEFSLKLFCGISGCFFHLIRRFPLHLRCADQSRMKNQNFTTSPESECDHKPSVNYSNSRHKRLPGCHGSIDKRK